MLTQSPAGQHLQEHCDWACSQRHHQMVAVWQPLVCRLQLVSLCWPDLIHLQAQVEKNVRFVWRFLMMPLLFGLIGASMVFRTLTQSSIPKACAIVIAGEHQAWLTGPLSCLLCPAACLYMPGCLLIGPSCSRVLHSNHAVLGIGLQPTQHAHSNPLNMLGGPDACPKHCAG